MSLGNGDNGNSNGSMQRFAENSMLKALSRVFQVVGVPFGVVLLTVYLQSANDERKSINETLTKLNASVAVLQDRSSNLYTSEQAKADFEQRDNQIGDLREAVTAVNGKADANAHRIEALEAWRGRYRRTP